MHLVSTSKWLCLFLIIAAETQAIDPATIFNVDEQKGSTVNDAPPPYVVAMQSDNDVASLERRLELRFSAMEQQIGQLAQTLRAFPPKYEKRIVLVEMMKKTQSDMFGLSIVRDGTNTKLIIIEIHEGGLLDRWNEQHFEEVVSEKCAILQVNGKRGNAKRMMNELTTSGIMAVKLLVEIDH